MGVSSTDASLSDSDDRLAANFLLDLPPLTLLESLKPPNPDIRQALLAEIRTRLNGAAGTFEIEAPAAREFTCCQGTLVLPHLAEALEATDRKKLDPLLNRKRILYLEDNDLVIGAIGALLRDRGAEVTVATTVGAARKLIGEQPSNFDLIICDLDLPDGTGLDFYRALNQVFDENPNVGPKPPIVFSTGFGYDPNHVLLNIAEERRKCGADREIVIPKSEFSLLFPLLHEAINRQAASARRNIRDSAA